jgi:hypothetical protein
MPNTDGHGTPLPRAAAQSNVGRMAHEIAAVSGRPELAPIVAAWLVDAFGYEGGRTVDQMTALILAPPKGPEETLMLVANSMTSWLPPL